MPYVFQATYELKARLKCDMTYGRRFLTDSVNAIGQWCVEHEVNILQRSYVLAAIRQEYTCLRAAKRQMARLLELDVLQQVGEDAYMLFEIAKSRQGQQKRGRPRVISPHVRTAKQQRAAAKGAAGSLPGTIKPQKCVVKSTESAPAYTVKGKYKAEEKNKNPTTCTAYANEKASPMPEAAPQSTAAQHPDIPHTGTMDRSLADLLAGAHAQYTRHKAAHPEQALEAPSVPRRVAAAPPATPRQAKTPQRQIEAPGPHPPTPPPNEHEILEALLEMDVDERDWDTRDRVRGMIVAGKIERLALEHAVYEYRMRRRDATREPVHCASRWLVLRLPAGQAKLEAARRAVGMVATFAESKAGMRHSADGEKSSQEKAS